MVPFCWTNECCLRQSGVYEHGTPITVLIRDRIFLDVLDHKLSEKLILMENLTLDVTVEMAKQ